MERPEQIIRNLADGVLAKGKAATTRFRQRRTAAGGHRCHRRRGGRPLHDGLRRRGGHCGANRVHIEPVSVEAASGSGQKVITGADQNRTAGTRTGPPEQSGRETDHSEGLASSSLTRSAPPG